MLRRRASSAVSGILNLKQGGLHQHQQLRWMSIPGWRTMVPNRKERTLEEREAERKTRQIEKLPPAQILADFPYEDDKVVLGDMLFQPTVYEDELDTPYLFDLGQSTDFVLHWNAADFDQTSYPPVPEADHRTFSSSSEQFVTHTRQATKYMRKHGVVPDFVPHSLNSVNLSVVFGDKEKTKSLTADNFWHTAHCGNYVELIELQDLPSIYLVDAPETTYYTLVIASPDYPFRTSPNRGFYLNTVVANLKGSKGEKLAPSQGDVVIPYTPPLPSDGAGTARILCMLFEQNGGKPIPNLRPPTTEEEQEYFPFPLRANYRFHAGLAPQKGMPSLRAVEENLTGSKGFPVTTTFLQTSWDIQVQEFYESVGVPEPNYIPEDMEDILRYNARPTNAEHIKGRRQPDGTLTVGEEGWYTQHARKRDPDLANMNLSRRTLLSKDGKFMQRPKSSSR